MIFLPWVRISLIQNSLKQSFTKCLNWLKLNHLVFNRLPLAFFLVGCFANDLLLLSFVNFSHLHVYFRPCCLGFSLVQPTYRIPLETLRTIILHALQLHHFLACFQHVPPLEDQLAWPKFEAPQESQFFMSFSLMGSKTSFA